MGWCVESRLAEEVDVGCESEGLNVEDSTDSK